MMAGYFKFFRQWRLKLPPVNWPSHGFGAAMPPNVPCGQRDGTKNEKSAKIAGRGGGRREFFLEPEGRYFSVDAAGLFIELWRPQCATFSSPVG
ncbi:MAG: hypothetical protein LBP65_03370 [Puniceicoccales bacterium]|nr:hypothetical protein [Puniceicoccales bacterium]